MADQPNKEVVLKKIVSILVHRAGLTSREVAELKLSHVHLAGKNPHIIFTLAGSQETKTVELDLEAHRAMVGWLVMRPDSTGDYLFPGSDSEMMDPAEMARLAGEDTGTAVSRPADVEKPAREAVTPPETTGPPRTRPVPLPSRPEMGAPPPGVGSGRAGFNPLPPTAPESDKPVNFQSRTVRPVPPPPPTAPESDETVSIPLPNAAPGSSPPPPTGPVLPVAEEVEVEAEPTPAIVQKGREEPPPSPSPEKAGRPVARKRASTGARPVSRRMPPTARQVAEASPSRARRLLAPALTVVVVLGCLVCAGGGWFALQSEPGSQLLASLGLGGIATPSFEAIPQEEAPQAIVFESPIDSPLPTPTLPPTSTPTVLAPTNTPVPVTNTATPAPTDTPALPPTDTPVPSDTPAPTNTPAPAESASTPTVEATPTPGMKYGAPALLEPADNYEFIPGNTIVLRWQPVDLAQNEQYAVRLVYRYNNETVYQGANLKEPEWTVPLALFGKIDGPDNRYEWFVVIERVNDDGTGTAVSPESQRRSFIWK